MHLTKSIRLTNDVDNMKIQKSAPIKCSIEQCNESGHLYDTEKNHLYHFGNRMKSISHHRFDYSQK